MLKNYFSYDKKSDTVSINQVLWHILNTADILRLRDIRACSHKKSIKNHSQHDNRKKN